MTPKLSFKTIPTSNGPVHLMRITSVKNDQVIEREYRLFLAQPTGIKRVNKGIAYQADNGSWFRIGRCNSGMAIAWKTTKIGARFADESYRMRSVPGGYLGDYCRGWSRNINGHTYDFSRVYWNAGRGGMTITVRRLGEEVHSFHVPGPVLMKKD